MIVRLPDCACVALFSSINMRACVHIFSTGVHACKHTSTHACTLRTHTTHLQLLPGLPLLLLPPSSVLLARCTVTSHVIVYALNEFRYREWRKREKAAKLTWLAAVRRWVSTAKGSILSG